MSDAAARWRTSSSRILGRLYGLRFGMHSSFPVDAGILLGAALVIVGVVVGGVADRYRFPGLVLFLLLGMAVADDGLGLVHFGDARLAQNVAIVALVVISVRGRTGDRARSGTPGRRSRGRAWRPSAWS